MLAWLLAATFANCNSANKGGDDEKEEKEEATMSARTVVIGETRAASPPQIHLIGRTWMNGVSQRWTTTAAASSSTPAKRRR
jgi:hypothetical protein